MVRLISALACLILLSLAGCGAKNVANGSPGLPTANISAAPGNFSYDWHSTVTWTVTVSQGSGPYRVAWDFGGGANPDSLVQTGVTGPASSVTVEMANPGTYTARVEVTNAVGVAIQSGTLTHSYVVGPGPEPPVVDSATVSADGRLLTVVVSDSDNPGHLTVTITPPAGFTVDEATQTLSGIGTLTAEFAVGISDIFAGATGNFGVTVSNGHAVSAFPGGVDVTVAPLVVPADTLLAVPIHAHAAVGEPVTVIVATAAPAHDLLYVPGCGLTTPTDADLVPSSFNLGLPGGAAWDGDGIWAIVAPASGFLSAGAVPVLPVDLGNGRERWDFSITPLSPVGGLFTTGGVFSCQFTFSTPGVKTFGFVQQDAAKRTYYADNTGEYFWGSIVNDGSIAPNTVTVE